MESQIFYDGVTYFLDGKTYVDGGHTNAHNGYNYLQKENAD